MAKSRETFSKKEKEKKKIKRKQQKEEKKEERKANSNKGEGFQSMLAYVDEYGNITSTPPDPGKKEEIKAEDIEIGVARQKEPEYAETRRNGTLTFFNEAKGYGFIKDHESQESIFVHIKSLNDPVKERDKVSFEVEMTAKGPNAVDVKRI